MLSDLFDLHQGQSETHKTFLSRFNKMTIQVDESDEKFYVSASLKGLRTGTFSEALIIQKPGTMHEIRTRAKKHIDAYEATSSRM